MLVGRAEDGNIKCLVRLKIHRTRSGLFPVATLNVFREVWAFGIATQLQTHASRGLPLVARVQRGYQHYGENPTRRRRSWNRGSERMGSQQ
jgi:hypothetical protein